MTYQGKYCSLGTVPARWQAGVFSLLIHNGTGFRPSLGSSGSEVASYFDSLLFNDFFFSLREDAVVAFAAMAHTEASTDPAMSERLGNVKKWKVLTCAITEKRLRRMGAMSFALRNFIRGAGKLPIVTFTWSDNGPFIGLLEGNGFVELYREPDYFGAGIDRVCYVRHFTAA